MRRLLSLGRSALLGVLLLAWHVSLGTGTPQPLEGEQQGGAPLSAGAPFHLVIDAGGHLDIIREVLFTADGRELISVSNDKTIRVWTVTPDGRQATLAGIEQAFQQVATRITAEDVFVLYLAGHGVTRDGRYYFLPQDFHRGAETVQPARSLQLVRTSTQDFHRREAETLQRSGVTQERLQAWLARIKAHRSMILIDTCESGSLVHNASALQVAIEKLSHATGRATIVAAMETQPALEGYKGHGVFTYVLLQALYYADQHYGNRDGMTSIFEIASHVDAHVPTITREAFGVEQFSQVHILWRNFSIGTTSQK